MELQEKQQSGPSGEADSPQAVFFARLTHLVGAQPGVFGLLLVLVLWFGINGPGLGGYGLWDPWEMDRAHVARQMVAPPRILVVEPLGTNAELGPIASWLDARYRDTIVLATPQENGPNRSSSATNLLAKAATQLDTEVFHLLLVDLSAIAADPGAHVEVEPFVAWLEGVRVRNPGLRIVLVQALPDTQSPNAEDAAKRADLLRQTYAEVRIELAGRELSGRSWGRPGPFRRELVKVLKYAREGGYPAAPGLSVPEQTSFIDRGFWKAAEKRKLADRLRSPVPRDARAALVDSPSFSLSEPIVTWPTGPDHVAILADFESNTSVAPAVARDSIAAVEAEVDASLSMPWQRAQFKADKLTRSVAPLDYWLMAASFNALGFSELASRLPAFLMALLALLIAFRTVQLVFGPMAATLTGVVLVTSPLFFAQARSVAGEVSYTLALTLIAAGFLLTVQRNRRSQGPYWMVLFGGLIAFFGQGLFGLLVPLVIGLAYLAVGSRGRKAMLAPVALLLFGFAVAWGAVTQIDGWTFWSHFDFESPLFSWALKDSDRPVFLNFDRLVRQIGFGMLPWVALLPFGLALLVTGQNNNDPSAAAATRRSTLLVVALWFFVPYVVQSMVLKGHNHLIFPAIPAAAVGVALLLCRVLEGRGLGTVIGLAGAITVGLLLANARKSPEPLTSFLTTDPPLVGIKAQSDYPEALKLPTLLKLSLVAIAALMMLHAARLGTRIRLVAAFFTRPRPFAITLTLLVTALFALLLGGLESQIAQSFTTRAGQTLEAIHRLYVRDVFYWRPHLWALYVVLAGGGVAFLTGHTRLLQSGGGWVLRWIFTAAMSRFVGLGLAVGALGISVGPHYEPSVAAAEAFAGLPTMLIVVGLAIAMGLGLLRTLKRSALDAVAGLPIVGPLTQAFGGAVVAIGLVTAAVVFAALQALSALGEVKEAVDGATTVYVLGALAILFTVLPSVVRPIYGKITGENRQIGAKLKSLWNRLAPLERDSMPFILSHVALIKLLLVAAIALTIAFGSFQPGFVVWATISSPVFIGGLVAMAIVAGLIAAGRRNSDSAFAALAKPQTTVIVMGLMAAWILGGVFAQLFAESGLRNMDFLALPTPRDDVAISIRLKGYVVGNLVLAAGLLGVNLLWGPMRRRAQTAWAVMMVSGVAAGIMMVTALSGKWLHLEPAVLSADSEPFLPYLFALSRRTQLLYGSIAVVLLLGLGARIPQVIDKFGPLRRIDGAARRTLRRTRRPFPTAVWLLIAFSLLTTATTGFYGLLLVPPVAMAIALSPLSRLASGDTTAAMMIRGGIQIAPAALVAVIPAFVEMARANPMASTLMFNGIIITVLVFAAWALVVAMRLGLGLDDLLGSLSAATPAAAIVGALTLVDQARAGSLESVGTTQLLLLGIGAVLLLALAVNHAARWVSPFRVVELLERPRIFVVALSLAVASFAFFYNQRLVTAFSFHVSQKHLIETVEQAEDGEIPEGRLLQHGLAGQSSRNFYTSAIDEIRDATVALQALSGTQDTLLPLTRSGSSVTRHRVVAGFAPQNDVAIDGRRDWNATTGIATGRNPDEGFLEDSSASWADDQWSGHWLYDSAGWSFPITRNTGTRVYYDAGSAKSPASVAARPDKPTPAFAPRGGAKSVYRIDHPDAPRHNATAMVRERLYFLLPKVGGGTPAYTDKGSFSALNHKFRQLSGRHLAVLDDRSSRILLATSHLLPGEDDKNWLKKAIIDEDEFRARLTRGQVRGVAANDPMGGMLTWEDSIRLLGWSMDNYSVSKGKEFELTLYFQSLKPVTTSYKTFIHGDRSGHRIHTDHWILAVSKGGDGKHCIGCFQTDHWMPGDIIVDTYRREVPYGAPSGETDFWLGLFNPNGDKRAKITKWNDKLIKYNGSDNRPSIGSFVVR